MIIGAQGSDYSESFAFQRGVTAVDEMVGLRLDQISAELEEKKIQHERVKQEELRKLENEKRLEVARIAEEADDDIQYMKDSLKHEIKAAKQGLSEEQRRDELKRLSRENI